LFESKLERKRQRKGKEKSYSCNNQGRVRLIAREKKLNFESSSRKA